MREHPLDGAFGLWAAASADSLGCEGHEWLNVPYDSAYVFCAHPDAHRASMSFTAAYLTDPGDESVRNAADWGPESSRRARGFATYAALRELGREGVAAVVNRCCGHARRFADQLGTAGFDIVNDVVLNQVLVRVADDQATTDRIVDAIQREGTCWLGATTWRGDRLVRISVSNHTTGEADVDLCVEAIIAAARSATTG